MPKCTSIRHSYPARSATCSSPAMTDGDCSQPSDMNENKAGLWRRFSTGLARTASRLGDGIANLGRRRLDKETLRALEDLLIQADLGSETAEKIIAAVGRTRPDQ